MRAAMALALSLLAVPALAADDAYRVKVFLGGGYQLATQSFDQTISFDLYQETANIKTSYSADKAPGIDVGVQVGVFKHIGLAAAATVYNRDLNASYDASFPHPLFFDQPRLASGAVSGKQKETAGHLSVVAFGRSGAFDLSAWAGVSFFKVEANLLQNVVYTQSYPFDSVTVTGTPNPTVSDSPIGFNLGASVDRRFGKHLGAGIQARFARATAEFAVPNAPTAKVDAGGFQVGAGLRLFF